MQIPRGVANEVPLGLGKWVETAEHMVTLTAGNGDTVPWQWRPHFSYRWCEAEVLFVLNGLPHHFNWCPLALCEKLWIIISYATFSHIFCHLLVNSLSRILINFVCPHQWHQNNTISVLMGGGVGGFCTVELEFGIPFSYPAYLLPQITVSHFRQQLADFRAKLC